MKKVVQIAAGILLASAVIFVARLFVLQWTAERALQNMARQSAESSRMLREEREIRKRREAEQKRRALEEACYVITSDGRKLTCADY